MTQGMQSAVFVDGNNVMGSRPDGWWRNRAEAEQRLVAEIAPLARRCGGAWTIVFDGSGPGGMAPQECLAVVHAGHGTRDGADDRIVELVGAIPDRATALVYTSEAVPAHDRHGKLKAWLYGHTHTPGRRHVGDIEYVTQPRGFPDERRSRRLPAYRAARVTVTSR